MNIWKYLLPACLFTGAVSCRHEIRNAEQPVPSDNYPPEVGKIIINRCATAGCHNAASYQTSGGGLLMDSWEHMLDGGNTGAAVVAFSPEHSPLLFFSNPHEDFGPLPAEEMRMPLNGPPLTREEYIILREWIAAGAPDKNGDIPFAGNPETRQKIYLAHQGCDYVAVIDAEKNIIMRYIPIGTQPTVEGASSIKVAGDHTAYFHFWGTEVIQQIDTRTDKLTRTLETGYPNSARLSVAPDGSQILLTNIFMNSLLNFNTQNGIITDRYGIGSLRSPHGVTANRTFDTFYVTERYGNGMHKIASDGTHKQIPLDNQPFNTNAGGLNPYAIQMSPDNTRYFVSCSNSNEIRVIDVGIDQLIAVIPVGLTPQEMAVSVRQPYLFVTCMDDPSLIPVFKGSVYVINYHTLEVVARITDRFYMPHALAVDDVYGRLYVFSRNVDTDGPQPHHPSAQCEGRNGYYSVYDFLKMVPVNNRRYEVTVEPYAADTRFK